MFMTPLMICFMLGQMENINDSVFQNIEVVHQKIQPIGPMPKCKPPHGARDRWCNTVGYSIIGDPDKDKEGVYDYIHNLMKSVAKD